MFLVLLSYLLRSNSAHHIHAEDQSSEALPEVRAPLDAKKRLPNDSRLCHTLTDYRTIVEDYFKILDFIEWLKEYYFDMSPHQN